MALAARSGTAAPGVLGAARRLRPQHIPAAALAIAAAGIVAIGMFGPVLAPADPNIVNIAQAFKPPSPGAWFGTDETGRDILSRTIWGARVSLAAAGMVLLISIVLGVGIGAVAGYAGGPVDDVLMRIADLFLAFPGLVLAIAITAALGPSLRNAVIAIAIVWWPTYARLIRSRVLTVKAMLYIEAAHAVGLPDAKILLKHVLPQCWGLVVSRVTVDVGYAILLTASLSFLGLGSQPPTAEWGSMIATSRPYFFSYWWTVTFPGLAMFVTVLVFSFLGDALYETLGIKGGGQL